MFRSFLCRLFNCHPNPKIVSAKIESGDGFAAPVPIPDIEGWTVWKEHQTEIYKITHNLGLTDPERQMHVVATPMDFDTILVVQHIGSNDFIISAWGPGTTPKASAFMFIATLYS